MPAWWRPSVYSRAIRMSRRRGEDIFYRWIRGDSYEKMAEEFNETPERIRRAIKLHVMTVWRSAYKWSLAEAKCRALAMELNLLRLGKEAEPDKPIESMNMPPFWLRAFKRAGIDTVNQLRSVDPETLMSRRRRFPTGAVDWAALHLDMAGLSHRLIIKPHYRQKPTTTRLGKERTIR